MNSIEIRAKARQLILEQLEQYHILGDTGLICLNIVNALTDAGLEIRENDTPYEQPKERFGRVIYSIIGFPDQFFISTPNGNGYYNGISLLGHVVNKFGKRIRTERIDINILRPISNCEMALDLLNASN